MEFMLGSFKNEMGAGPNANGGEAKLANLES